MKGGIKMISDQKCRFNVTLKKETVADVKKIADSLGITLSTFTELLFQSITQKSADDAFSTFLNNYSNFIQK